MPIVVGHDSPFMQAALQFVTGLGAANRDAKAQQRQQQIQQQQTMGQAIGAAVGQIGSAPFQAQIMEAQRRNALADRLAIVNAQHANDLEEAWIRHRGETPDSGAIAAIEASRTWTPPLDTTQIAPLPTFAPGEENFTPAEMPDMTPAGGPPVEPGPGTYVPPPPGTASSGYGGSMISRADAVKIANQRAGMQPTWSPRAQSEIAFNAEVVAKIKKYPGLSDSERARALAYMAHEQAKIDQVLTPAPVTMQQRAQIESWTDPRTGFTYHSKDLAVTPPTKKSEELIPWAGLPPDQQKAAIKADYEATHYTENGVTRVFDPKTHTWSVEKDPVSQHKEQMQERQAEMYIKTYAEVQKEFIAAHPIGEDYDVTKDSAKVAAITDDRLRAARQRAGIPDPQEMDLIKEINQTPLTAAFGKDVTERAIATWGSEANLRINAPVLWGKLRDIDAMFHPPTGTPQAEAFNLYAPIAAPLSGAPPSPATMTAMPPGPSAGPPAPMTPEEFGIIQTQIAAQKASDAARKKREERLRELSRSAYPGKQ